MNKTVACLSILVAVSACASDESARRDPNTARAHAERDHHRHRTGEVTASELDAERRAADANAERRAAAPIVTDDRHGVGVDRTSVAPVPASAEAPATRTVRDDARSTPTDQRNNTTDLEITRKIRKAVVADDNLTAAAKNVKIVTEDGQVTLRGNVANDREKSTVETYAQQVAGTGNVQNQIDVK